jgi:hypothetical protein
LPGGAGFGVQGKIEDLSPQRTQRGGAATKLIRTHENGEGDKQENRKQQENMTG